MTSNFAFLQTPQFLDSGVPAARPLGALGSIARALLLAAIASTAACGSGDSVDSAAAVEADARRRSRVEPTPAPVEPAPAPIDPTTADYSCSFASAWQDCGFSEQAKVAGRATLVTVAGVNAVRLHTEPGDDNVYGSGSAERNDLSSSQATTDGYEGKEHWWAHSILFPDDYVDPPESTSSSWNFGAVADFHNTTNGAGQANFQITAMPATAIASDRPTGLNFQINHGDQTSPTQANFPIGPVIRNQWYNFVYHVKWSSGTDGFFDAWVNGVQMMAYRGPTLYPGQGVYFKLANYHTPHGQPSSVIHARVMRSAAALSVVAGL